MTKMRALLVALALVAMLGCATAQEAGPAAAGGCDPQRVPGPPASVKALVLNDTAVQVVFLPPNDTACVDSFVVRARDLDSGVPLPKRVVNASLSAVYTRLTPGAVYRFQVTASGAGAGAGRALQSAASFVGFWRIWPPWPVCPAQETLPAAVTLRYSFMGAGTHSVRFKAIAATPGVFVLPPVKAYVSRQPEVMGLSPGGKFKVCSARAAACDTSDLPLPAAPKRCAKDCNGNGACNLATGACICNAGFGGPACDQLAAV